MSKPAVVYDACVLYPAAVRDFLIHFARQGIFLAKWTDRIHDEWIRNLLDNRKDLSPERLSVTRRKMNEAVSDCLVVGYEAHLSRFELPDPDDAHVLAAAIQAEAECIVTFNLRDFPTEALRPFGIAAMTPDDFIESQLESYPTAVCDAAKAQRALLRNPPKSIPEYLQSLRDNRLTKLADWLAKAGM